MFQALSLNSRGEDSEVSLDEGYFDHSADCLLSLIDGILDFSKIEQGMLELDAVDFDLRHLLRDVCEMMAPAVQ